MFTKNHNQMGNGSWDTEWDTLNFFVILGHFLTFYPQNFEKNDKMPRDIILLHMCTIHEDHMMYDFWNIRCKWENFCHSGSFFILSPPWRPGKSNLEKFKNKKKNGDIITKHMCTINDNYMIYGSWDKECNTNFFLPFWTVFCPFTAFLPHP